MGDRSDVLTRASGMQKSHTSSTRPHGRYDTASNKRPNADSAAGGPSAKKQKFTPILLEIESALQRLPEEEHDRKRELKGWAQLMVNSISMNDLNYFLQAVKKTVEYNKEVDKKSKINAADNNSLDSGNGNTAAHGAGNAGINNNNTTGGPRSPSDNEGSADGNKPSRAGTFYPIANVKEDEDARKAKEAEKVFQRPKADKRSNEEENQYQDLLHSMSDNPVIVDKKLNESRFEEVITEALPIAKKLKDWFQIWSHSQIGPDQTTDCCVYLASRLCQEKDEEQIADILSHLIKEKEILTKNMEEALKKIDVSGRDKNKIVGHLLTFIYPTSKGDFGWQRIGWNFQHWWGFCKKTTRDLERPIEALQVCCEKLLEYKADLTSDKQEKIISRAEELVGSREAACEALGLSGDSEIKMQASPDTSDA